MHQQQHHPKGCTQNVSLGMGGITLPAALAETSVVIWDLESGCTELYVLLVSPTENSRTKNPDSSKCVVAYLAIHVDAQIQNSLQIIYRTFMVCMKTPDRTEGTRVFSQKGHLRKPFQQSQPI